MSGADKPADKPEGLETTFATILQAQAMRYLMITTWAVGLFAVTGWVLALGWTAAAVGWAFVRGRADRRQAHSGRGGPAGAGYYLIALANETIWSLAPLIGWLSGRPFGELYAVVTCLTGIHITIRQLDETPVRAFVVTSPFALVLMAMLARHYGDPFFWAALCALPLVWLGFFSHVIYGHFQGGVIRSYKARHDELVGDLEQARDRAEDASRAKSAFLAMMSHELRTPMNGVLGAAQLLEARPLAPVDRELASVVRTSGDTLLGLLNNLLDMVEVGPGEVELMAVDTDLPALLSDVGDHWKIRAAEQGIAVRMEWDKGLPRHISTDPGRLRQILNNLLSNAVKFTEAGEVVLIVTATPMSGGQVRLRMQVADTGVGVAEDQAARLFEPFFQSDGSLTERSGGMGLGLPIAHRLAVIMGGDLTWAARPGGGSVFTLEAPFTLVDWVSGDADIGGAEADGPLRVLVVEDHPVNRMVVETYLRSLGHETLTAENGQVAVDLADAQPCDLVLMDVNMPVMDGLTATRLIRGGQGPNHQTPIIIISASARPEDHDAGFAAGADGYLNKPVQFEMLASMLRRIDTGVLSKETPSVRVMRAIP